MTDVAQPTTELSAWKPYAPSVAAPWNLKRVVHLHRRAGFAASWPELQRDLQDGPKPALDRMLTGQSAMGGSSTDLTTVSQALLTAAVKSETPTRIKAWWLQRMLTSPDPLGERLTLMWHNHFATSNRKIKNLLLMREQNELFRSHARSRFSEMLGPVVKHPAILLWLDADANRKGVPNENLARELMELFTLGVGHYCEDDVKEVARALTGWCVADERFIFRNSRHDEGEKRVLGTVGRLNGDDVLRILLDQPATSQRLAWRIGRTFLGEDVPDEALKQLADGLRSRKLDVGWAVETVIRSELFFSDSQIGSRVLGPVEYVVGALHAQQLEKPGPNMLVLADWVTNVGQDLFYPPNVGGWKEGRSWLTSNMIIARANYAAALVAGTLWNPVRKVDLVELSRRYAGTSDLEESVAWFGRLFWGEIEPTTVLNTVKTAREANNSNPLSVAVALLLSSPTHYQS